MLGALRAYAQRAWSRTLGCLVIAAAAISLVMATVLMVVTQDFVWWKPLGYFVTLAILTASLLLIARIYATVSRAGRALSLVYHFLVVIFVGALPLALLAGIGENFHFVVANTEPARWAGLYLAVGYFLLALLVTPLVAANFAVTAGKSDAAT